MSIIKSMAYIAVTRKMLFLVVVAAILNLVIGKEVTCEEPVAPVHGSLRLLGNRKVASLVLYLCDDGWMLVGASAAKCHETGQWTSPPPRCIEKGSSSVSTTTAHVPTQASVPSSTPEHKERPGVIETPDIPLTPEITEKEECSCTYNSRNRALSATVNGLILRYGRKVKNGDKMTISCLDQAKHLVLPNDTNISGTLNLTCDACQIWTDGVLPSCGDAISEITCRELDETDLLKISYTDNLSVGSIANFHCFAPGIRSGMAQVQCLPTGEWSHSPPTCKKAHSCVQPANPEHGRVSYSSLKSGSVLRYECDNGFVLSHHKQRTCTEDGTWSNTEPVCTEVSCFPPANPKNGRVRYTSLKYDSELRYECDMGFVLSQRKQRKCTQDGKWSNSAPVCNEIFCEIPLSPEHGIVQIAGNRQVGSTARYSCEEGRKTDGPHISICLSDGQWEYPPPKCVKDTCEMPLSPEYGTVQLSSYPPKENSIAMYTCEEDRIMNGSSTSKCLANRQWSFPPPKCVKGGCEMPLSPEYGTVQLSSYPPKVNTRASFSCEQGRTMVGASVSKCLIGGRWQFQPPKCLNLGL